MNSWLDLEERFRRVAHPLQSLRLDFQWGSEGEYWRVCGMSYNQTVSQFESLVDLAGRKLDNSVDEDSEIGKLILTEQHPRIRWYRALKELSGAFEFGHYGHPLDDDGNPTGTIFKGSVNNVVAVSANLCLRFHAENPRIEDQTEARNLNIIDSTIGFLNTGSVSNVGTIKVEISKLQQDNQKELAEALEHLVDAINRSADIEDENRKALLDQLEELAHQANLEPSKRAKPGVIKSLLSSIAMALSSAGGLAEVWSTWGNKILQYFQQ